MGELTVGGGSGEVYKPLSHCKHSQFNSLTIDSLETQVLRAQHNLKIANYIHDLLLSEGLQTCDQGTKSAKLVSVRQLSLNFIQARQLKKADSGSKG